MKKDRESAPAAQPHDVESKLNQCAMLQSFIGVATPPVEKVRQDFWIAEIAK